MDYFQLNRSFRKYKSASIHFAKPYNEKYRKEFEQEIGKENFTQWVLEFDVIPCPMNPFQSGKAKNASKFARLLEFKNYIAFSYSKNMANFEAFFWNFSSCTNSEIGMSDGIGKTK